MITNNIGDPEINSTEEYHSMTWRVSLDGMRTWDDLQSARLDTPASPLSRALQGGLRAGMGDAGRNRINLFDYFSPGVASTSYFEAVKNSWNFDQNPSYTSDITELNYSVNFCLYYDDIMQEFVIAKRADGEVNNKTFLMFLKSVGYNVFRWEPVVVVDFRGSQIEVGMEDGTTETEYEVMDVEIESFPNDLNYMMIKFKQSDDSIYWSVTPFKFLAKIANSYDASTDSIYASIQNNPYHIRRGAGFDLLINKTKIPDTTIVPNYWQTVVTYVDDYRYNIGWCNTTTFQDCLVCFFAPLEFDPSNDIWTLGISRSWKNWYEERPYRLSVLPSLYSDVASKMPDTTFWTLNLGGNGGIASPTNEGNGSYWRFSGAESSLNNGYNYYASTAGSGKFFENMNCKVRTRIRVTPPVTSYTNLQFDLFDILFGGSSFTYSQRIVTRFNYNSLTQAVTITFHDGTVAPSSSLKATVTLTDIDPETYFDLVVFYDTSDENTAKVFVKYRQADGTYNRPYLYDSKTFTLGSQITLNRGVIRWGIFEFKDIEAGLNNAVFYLDMAYFCYSDYYSFSNDNFPPDKCLTKHFEGYTSEDFISNNLQYAFGRKASSNPVSSYYGNISLKGYTNNANVFYYGQLQLADDMYNLISSYSDVKMQLPMYINDPLTYEMKIRFDSVRKEFFNKILFVKCFLQPLTINFYNDSSDTTIRDTVSTEQYTVYNINNEFGVLEITDDLEGERLEYLIDPENYYGVTNTGIYFEIDSVFDKYIVPKRMTMIGNGLFVEDSEVITGETRIILVKKSFEVECPQPMSQPCYYSFEIVMPQDGIDSSILEFFEYVPYLPYNIGLIGLCNVEPVSDYVSSVSLSASNGDDTVSSEIVGNIIASNFRKNKKEFVISFVDLANKQLLQFERFVSLMKQMFVKDKMFLKYADGNFEQLIAVYPDFQVGKNIAGNKSDGSIQITFRER